MRSDNPIKNSYDTKSFPADNPIKSTDNLTKSSDNIFNILADNLITRYDNPSEKIPIL